MCVYTCARACMCVCMCVMHVYMMCARARMYAYMHVSMHACACVYTYINIMSKTQQYLALAAQFERKRPGGWCSIVVWRQRERETHASMWIHEYEYWTSIQSWKDLIPFRISFQIFNFYCFRNFFVLYQNFYWNFWFLQIKFR